MSKLNRRSTGIALSYVNTVANAVIGLFLSAYIVRQIGSAENGVYQSMSSFLSYLTVLEFGIGSIMTRNISLCRKDGSDEETILRNVSTVWYISLGLSVLILLAAGVFYCFIDRIYAASMTEAQIGEGKLIFLLMTVRLLASFLSQGLKGCILGFERYSVAQVLNLAHLLVRTALVFVLLRLYRFALVVVIIDLTLQLLTFLYYLFYCGKRLKLRFSLKRFTPAIFREMTPLAFAMFLQTIVNTANGNVDKFVISILMTPVAVSVYSVGMYVFNMFSSLMVVPISMYMPQIAGDMRSGKRGRELMPSLVPPCRFTALMGGAVLFGFFAVGKPFLQVFYGPEYLDAWRIALVVMLPSYINMTVGVLINVLDVLRKRHIRSLCLLLTTGANIVLTVLWVKGHGMLGAALATCVCTFLGQDILLSIYYTKRIGIHVPTLLWRSYRGVLPALLLAGAGAYGITLLFENRLHALLLGGFGYVLLAAGLLLCFGLNASERDQIRAKLKKIGGKP